MLLIEASDAKTTGFSLSDILYPEAFFFGVYPFYRLGDGWIMDKESNESHHPLNQCNDCYGSHMNP